MINSGIEVSVFHNISIILVLLLAHNVYFRQQCLTRFETEIGNSGKMHCSCLEEKWFEVSGGLSQERHPSVGDSMSHSSQAGNISEK